MSEEFLVGCPVYRRAWVLPQWFEHVREACAVAGVDPLYAFVVDPDDEETIEVISNEEGAGYVYARGGDRNQEARTWNSSRYEWMVEIRNDLLGIVRQVEPRLFLSLDSDILIHRDSIKNLMETSENCDAVGGKAYMTPMGRSHPSWARISREGGLIRFDGDGVFPVEVIMAMKLMRPSAYAVDYEFHRQGEDIGWSLGCARAGLKLMWDGRVPNKHVMTHEMLNRVDSRVGF